MDATWIAAAGIAGTLLSPVIAGRAQRTALREERILDRRLDAYIDLLETARHLHENAQTWSAIPLAQLEEPPGERLRLIDARIRTVGSKKVFDAMHEVARLLARFQRDLWPARLRHQRDEQAKTLSVEAVAARVGLGGIADEITSALEKLESTIRKEMKL